MLSRLSSGEHFRFYDQEVSDMAARDTNKPDTTKTDEAEAAPEPTTSQPADPQRVIIEQAPAEPAVFYGEGGLVPGSGNATDPNKPHVKADYKPFEW